MNIDERTRMRLQIATHKYWDIYKDNWSNAIKNIYITQSGKIEGGLLWQELEIARAQGRLNISAAGGVLALLVGHSLEPLIQMIVCAKPRAILLVLNEEYNDGVTGHQFGRKLEELIDYLHQYKHIDVRPPILNKMDDRSYILTKDNPVAIFSFLREHLTAQLQKGNQVLVDITGGKKSMVAGAFLFAAYARINVTYVDFERYNPEYGRPYGYSCMIGCISNPYLKFALREWEEVRRLYKVCGFNQAAMVLDSVIKAMQADSDREQAMFDQSQINAVIKMQKMLNLYHLWDNSDFHKALSIWNEIGIRGANDKVPGSVLRFGRLRWPTLQRENGEELSCENLLQQLGAFNGEFYSNSELVMAYTRDELARIKRLLYKKGEYRAAFQRAASLYELLMRVRAVELWNKGWIKVDCRIKDSEKFMFISNDKHIEGIPNFLWKREVEIIKEAKKKVFNLSTWEWLRSLLANKGKWERELFPYNQHPQIKVIFAIKNDSPVVYNEDKICSKGLNGTNFRDLRNKSFHTYPPVPGGIALEAYNNAQLSFNDLVDNFWPKIGVSVPGLSEAYMVEQLPWKELCELCGVDFLPPGTEGRGLNEC